MRLSSKNISHIKQKIEIDNASSIVRINVTESDGTNWADDECNYNIYCVDQAYDIVWQVSETKTKPISIFGETDSFHHISKNDKDKIVAFRFSGFEYVINPETGEAIRIAFHK